MVRLTVIKERLLCCFRNVKLIVYTIRENNTKAFSAHDLFEVFFFQHVSLHRKYKGYSRCQDDFLT